ncbi:MAG: amidase [Gemmatimonadetes bacterium]|nr:amidase [Gemmatimonadota bacterium]
MPDLDRLTAAELAAIDRWEPRVHALVDWDPAIARDRAERAGPGPLSGWSVAVKDIIDVAGLPTRCNAEFTDANPVLTHAVLVDKLLACGAYVAAKSVTTTFAYLDPGPTRNPWHLDHTPGGSSSGSAAAVACGMVRLALGTQTVGSINRPASYCGVVGFKPTYGCLAVDGVFPLAPSLDTVGYFTANAVDAQQAFAALTERPPVALSGALRIAVVADMLCEPADPVMLNAVRGSADRLNAAGHQTSVVVLPRLVGDAYENHRTLVAAEAAQSHRELFSRFGEQYPAKLRQLIEYGQTVGPGWLEEIQSHRERTKAALDEALGEWDVVISPSAPGAAPRGIEATGDPRMNLIWTYAGLPTLTLPAALDDQGLPVGVQLTGARMQDAALMAAGVVVESTLGFAAQPQQRSDES